MKALQRVPRVKTALGFYVGGVSGFGRIEATAPNQFTVEIYSRNKLLFIPTHTQQAKSGRGVGNALILQIDRSADLSQIAQSVIAPNAINVVNVARRPSAVGVEPSKPVRGVKFAINADRHIPVVKRVCRRKPYGDSVRRWLDPSEYPGVLVVGQTFAKTVAGNIDSSHAVVPYKQWTGQKPACVGSTCGLRHFSQ